MKRMRLLAAMLSGSMIAMCSALPASADASIRGHDRPRPPPALSMVSGCTRTPGVRPGPRHRERTGSSAGTQARVRPPQGSPAWPICPHR